MIRKYFLSISKRKFIFLSFTIPLFYTLIGSAIAFIFIDKVDTSNKLQHFLFAKKIFYGVLLIPFIETFIFQYLPIELLKLFAKNKEFFITVISGGLFGFAHYFNNRDYFFSIAAFFAGLIFASIYLYSKKRKDISFPFLLVFSVHSVINLISISINYFYYQSLHQSVG
jgi:membrane protease YdiL (CAAX protease family)